MIALKRHLKLSKARRFIAAPTINSRADRYPHCWRFENSYAEGRSR